MSSDDELEARAWRFFLGIIGALVFVAGIAFFCGCATDSASTSGYDADTTPTHDGEEWVGGERAISGVVTSRGGVATLRIPYRVEQVGEQLVLVVRTRVYAGEIYEAGSLFRNGYLQNGDHGDLVVEKHGNLRLAP